MTLIAPNFDVCFNESRMFFVCIWMSEKEKSAVHVTDMVNCSADDYTLRLMRLPAPAKGKSANLDLLKLKIKAHFDVICNISFLINFSQDACLVI